MNKSLVFMLALVTLLSAGVASLPAQAGAQTYYPYTAPTYSTGCISVNRDLSMGMRGTDVTALQTFLVAQNYPGSGSWMLTGYFGAATAAAVRDYQSQHGLPQTGVADSATRASIGACNQTSSYTNTYTNTYPYNANPYNTNYNYTAPFSFTPTYPAPPYNSSYPYGVVTTGAVSITSLTVTSAVTGAPVSVIGSGFDPNNNTVYVGSVPVTGIPSANGTSLSFVVPQNVSGSVMVYVANSRGSSNSLPLNVINYYGSTGCGYPYNYGYTTYGSGTPCQNASLSITSVSPDSGAVGSPVTVFGSGFSTTGNTVHFGNGIITNVGSSDGLAVSFTVPAQLVGYNSTSVSLGTYPISVTNSSGYTSNALSYTVTALGGTNAPSITNVSGPSTLSTGVAGTWTVTLSAGNSTYTSVSVNWGDQGVYGYTTAAPQVTYLSGSQTFTFTHSYAQSGNYTVIFTVTNINGQTNTTSATVAVSGTGSGQVTLSSVSPSIGRVGSQVILQGSGFTTYDNAVHFGIGGTQHLVSQNGTQIYFTIPSYVSPCDISTSGTFCSLIAQQVTPGTYQMYVTNALGQTGQVSFTVTQ
jgi:peptidoglycan hydrolase-like protein with peptidoglycan-binding domain